MSYPKQITSTLFKTQYPIWGHFESKVQLWCAVMELKIIMLSYFYAVPPILSIMSSVIFQGCFLPHNINDMHEFGLKKYFLKTHTPLLTAEDVWFFAISTYNSQLPSIFGTNALISHTALHNFMRLVASNQCICSKKLIGGMNRRQRLESVQDFLIKLGMKPLMHLSEISHRQSYQNYEQSQQKLGTSIVNKVL